MCAGGRAEKRVLWEGIPFERSPRTASTETESPTCLSSARSCASASTRSWLRPTTSDGERSATESRAERCHDERGARGVTNPYRVCAYQNPRKSVPSAPEMIVSGRKSARFRYASRTETSGMRVLRRCRADPASQRIKIGLVRTDFRTHFSQLRLALELCQRNTLRGMQRQKLVQERHAEPFRLARSRKRERV